MKLNIHPRKISTKLLLISTLLYSSISFSESWNWYSYLNGVAQTPGYVVLNESSPGTGTIQFYAGNLVQCLRSRLNATIVRNSEMITITTEPAFNGCFEVKLNIKADGSGEPEKRAQIKICLGFLKRPTEF